MKQITAVGIDVSKGRSMVAARQPGGVIVAAPFKINHTATELNQLIQMLHQYPGEVRIVMEHTGAYWRPIALALVNAGFFVSVVNAMLIHDFHDNSLRRVKTDKADALKIANYALTFWAELRPYTGEDEIRQLLKTQCRLYERIITSSVSLRNGLIALLDQTFPGINQVFYVMRKESDGHIKWVDFVRTYWHKDCVTGLSRLRFHESYASWCKRECYRFSASQAEQVYSLAQSAVTSLPKNANTKVLITQAVDSLNAVYDVLHKLRNEILQLAEQLPEFETIMAIHGIGPITGPKLMGEIGDIRRFTSKRALVAFAGVDAPPYQSGDFESKSRRVSKRGSPLLRRTLFQICSISLQQSNMDDPVFLFMDRKRAEGKHFYVYMVAGAAKLLRIYYARVKEVLDSESSIEHPPA